jgi:hypothetical protein
MGVEPCIRVGSWFLSAVCLLQHYEQLEKGHQKRPSKILPLQLGYLIF